MSAEDDQCLRGESSEEHKSIPVQTKESARYCWVCFATDEEDREAAWVQPCNCRGTTKWVKFKLLLLEINIRWNILNNV